MKFVSEEKRSHRCGELRASHSGKTVTLMGWVASRRDHGGLVFIDLRDREGRVQIILNPNESTMSAAKELRQEFVVAVQGKVRMRPDGSENKKLETGEIEVEATVCEILSASKVPPFQIDDDQVGEMLRLKYRYLDLRSPVLQKNLKTRHEFNQLVRKFLSESGFYEIETPILYKSTPEGARDYLVPSRVFPGNFYALPQSPQTLKQLLMIAGYDRYFQIARCFRDEDLRADRQPEFTQIDLEMSFVDVEDILAVNEQMLRLIWKTIKGVDVAEIPRLTFHEAMSKYGSDKPDLRFGLEIQDVGEHLANTGFKIFDDVVKRGGAIKALCVPGGATQTRSQLDRLTELAKKSQAKGLIWVKLDAQQGFNCSVKAITEAQLQPMLKAVGAKPGDLVLMVADDFEIACQALGQIRLFFGRELNLIKTDKDYFCWVVDFPLLEYSPDEKRWAARHHPFTSPQDKNMEAFLAGDEAVYGQLLAKAYDLVCNGYEIAGGSIRIHRNEIQQAMFKCLGLTPEETELKFGFFLEALQYGTPPHGGIAWGVDRTVMILCGTDAIREIIAFPKTTKAQCLMSSTPGPVSREQLIELGIRVIQNTEVKE